MSAIIQDNAVVHYEVLGHGKPLIFLHSWIGSWRYWISSMQYASKHYRAYAIDLWGFGATKKESSRYSLEQQVLLLDGFIKQMGMSSLTLIGHGLGGIIATYYAADHPESVEKLMVVSFPMGVQSTNSRLQSLSPPDLADWMLSSNPPNPESQEDAKKTDHQAISTALSQFKDVNWRQLINRVSVASIWVYGQHDQAVTNPNDDQLSYLPEFAQFLVFSDSGHYPMLDEPSKFNRLLTDFVHLLPGEDPRQLEIRPIWRRRVR
jgi:pimeloyl-ACP methyl ester carboxylesterase